MPLSLNSILNLVSQEDPTLFSFHCSKITLLFLQEYIMVEQSRYLSIYFECLEKMMGHLDTLGVS